MHVEGRTKLVTGRQASTGAGQGRAHGGGGTSSRKSTFGMAADFADSRPIVGTKFGTMVGMIETAPDAPISRLNDAKETT